MAKADLFHLVLAAKKYQDAETRFHVFLNSLVLTQVFYQHKKAKCFFIFI